MRLREWQQKFQSEFRAGKWSGLKIHVGQNYDHKHVASSSKGSIKWLNFLNRLEITSVEHPIKKTQTFPLKSTPATKKRNKEECSVVHFLHTMKISTNVFILFPVQIISWTLTVPCQWLEDIAPKIFPTWKFSCIFFHSYHTQLC